MEASPPFRFKTNDELQRMSFNERGCYFEDLLAEFYTRKGSLDGLEARHLEFLRRRRALRTSATEKQGFDAKDAKGAQLDISAASWR